jgi:hypothetical protein
VGFFSVIRLPHDHFSTDTLIGYVDMQSTFGTSLLSGLPKALAAISLIAGLTSTAHAQSKQKHLSLVGISSATVAPHGMGFVGLSYTTKRAIGNSGSDGSAVVGFGLGDANKTIGLQFSANITSLTDDFGDSGYFEVKASKLISSENNPTYASLTLGQLANWGDADGIDETAKIALTHFTQWTMGAGQEQYPVMMTIGAGTNLKNFDSEPAIFAGIGIGLSEYVSTSFAWTGDSVSIGGGFKIKGADDLVIAVSFDDAFNQLDRQRLTVSVGYKFKNLFGG